PAAASSRTTRQAGSAAPRGGRAPGRRQGPVEVGHVDQICWCPVVRAEREEGTSVSEQDVVPVAAAGETVADTPTPEAAAQQGPASVTVKRLEEEGEIAADYLEELLDIADLDGDIDLSIDHGRASVEVITDDGSDRSLKRLVGKDGEVLDALQELTRLAVQARTGERSRLMLDVAGHRKHRRIELTAVAEEAITRVKREGGSVSLEPMNPFERKVVHDAVAAAGLVSDSDGVEP